MIQISEVWNKFLRTTLDGDARAVERKIAYIFQPYYYKAMDNSEMTFISQD